jgi:hypothetical protein
MAQTIEPTPSLKEIMERERERIRQTRADLAAQLESLDAELAGIAAYFTAMTPRPQQAPRIRTPSGERRERGYVQERVRDTIYEHPDGISSGDITRALKDISGQSIQNALSALRKGNHVIKDDARGGKYRPVTIEPTPQAEENAAN